MKSIIKIVMSGFAVLILMTVSGIAQPKLTITETNFDFGSVPQKASVSHNFWLKSTGSDTLKIVKVIPGCGCTKMPLEKNVLAPGDSTRLELIFNSRQYNKPVKRSPSIITNEPNPKHRIHFSANVFDDPEKIKPLMFDPPKIKINENQIGKTMVFTIDNKSKIEQQLKLIDFPDDMLFVEIPESIGPGERVQVRLILNKDIEMKKFTKSITIELADNEHTRFTLPIN